MFILKHTRIASVALVGMALTGPFVCAGERSGKAPTPNMIVIFTDDHGYADLRCAGARSDVKTPHLDRLAADGIRFTSGYVTAPQCIPSRAALLTGRYQGRFGVDHNGTIPMPLSEILISQRLQQAGYATGMVGKWHLDPNREQEAWIEENLPGPRRERNGRVLIPHDKIRPYLPDARGFTDCFCGQINDYWATYDLDGTDVKPARKIRKTGFRLEIQTDAALAFIDRHAKEPFFLYLAYFAPHVPLEATPKYLRRFPGEMPERRRTALAMISAIDDGVGRIRERLGRHGIDRNTLIFFISDNGAPLKLTMEDIPLSFRGGAWDGSRNDPWVGEKGMLAEGGIRVPFMAAWPGTLPSGKACDHPVSSLDVAATALALARLPPVPELDGTNLLPCLIGENAGAPHEALFWRFWDQSAIRKGRWKYLQAGRHRFLFDLGTPEHEQRNLIAEHPDLAGALAGELRKWASELKTPGLSDGEIAREKKMFEHYFGVR